MFKDKVIIITGATSGIGKSCTYKLAKESANLVLISRDREKLEHIYFELKDRCPQVIFFAQDISKEHQIRTIISSIINHFGRIDILINNAAVGARGKVEKMSLDYLEKIMRVNFFGAIYLIKEVLPHMKKRKSGLMVNIISMAAIQAMPNQAFYSASKYAFKGFCESFREEAYSLGINLLDVYPGKTKTNFVDHLLYNQEDKNNYYQGPGPDLVANHIVRAIKKRKKRLFVGWINYLFYNFSRFCPQFSSFLIRQIKNK